MIRRVISYLVILVVLVTAVALPVSLQRIERVYASTLTLVPNGAGDYTNITSCLPGTGEAHWEDVDDPVGTPDATTYVYTTSTSQLKDAYALTDTAQAGTINSVRVYFRIRACYGQPFLRLGSSETTGTEQENTGTGYITYNEILGRPGGGSWSWSDINSLQVCIGIRKGTGANARCTQEYIEVDYTSAAAPTVTISAASSVTDTSARLNGNITDTGGENPSVLVFWGDNDGGTTPANWDNNPGTTPDSPAQPQGVAAFYLDISGLDPNVTYYFSAKATNSGGTDWPAASLNFTTTYTLSISLTGPDVGAEAKNRDVSQGGSFTYIGADNPSNANGTLVSVEIWANDNLTGVTVGTFYLVSGTTYKCRDSENIGNIVAGAKRTVAVTLTVAVDDLLGAYWTLEGQKIEWDTSGYAGVYYLPEEAIDPGDQAEYALFSGDAMSLYGAGVGNVFDFGILQASDTSDTGLTYFTVLNDGNVVEDISIHGHDATGSGVTWTLSDDGSRGSAIYGLKAGLSGGSYNIVVRKNTVYNTLKSSLAVSGTQEFGLEIYSPSSNIGNADMTGTVTLTASLDV